MQQRAAPLPRGKRRFCYLGWLQNQFIPGGVMRRFAFLLFAVAAVSSFVCAQADHAAERVFFNAKVFTAEPEHPYAEAVAIRGDKIVAVGAQVDVMQAAGIDAAKIDLRGKA